MKNSRNLLLIVLAVVWLGSLTAAYFAGKKSGGSGNPAAGSTARIITNGQGGGGAGSGAALESSGAGGEVIGTAGGSAGSQLNVKALIGKVRSQLGAGPAMMYNPSAMMKAMAPMADLSEPQILEALEEVEATVNGPQQKLMFYSLLLGRLAETDGAVAMAYVDENLSEQGVYGMGVTMSVLGTWSRRDPEAAWAWFLENRDSDKSNSGAGFGQISAVFSGIAAKDVDLAFNRIESLEDFEKTQAISGIAMSGAWDPEYRERVLQRADSLPDETRQALHQGMIGQWTMTDPDGAIEWLDSLSDEERKPLARQAGSMLMMTDAKRGAEMMLENVPEEQLSGTYSSIISQWARRDPNAAGEWLNQQPGGANLDTARATFSRSVVQRDPYSAMQWAKTVENETQRQQAVRHVYNQWKGKDPQSADAALDQSGLASDKIEEIRKNVPKAVKGRVGLGGTLFVPQ